MVDGGTSSRSIETFYDFEPPPALVMYANGDPNGVCYYFSGPSGGASGCNYTSFSPWFLADYIQIYEFGDPWDYAFVTITVADPEEMLTPQCEPLDVLAGDDISCELIAPGEESVLTDIKWTFTRADNSQMSYLATESGPVPSASLSFTPSTTGTLRLSVRYMGSGPATFDFAVAVTPNTPPANIQQAWWDLMNAKEKTRCWQHPTECADVGILRIYAISYVNQLLERDGIPVTPQNSSNNKYDAFRHAYWSGVLAERIGQSAAEIWGTLHETGAAHYGNPEFAGQFCMDLYNNSQGRLAAQEVSGLPTNSEREIAIYNKVLGWMDGGTHLQTSPGC